MSTLKHEARLRESARVVETLQASLDDAKARRAQLILDALDAEVRPSRVAELTGLNRMTIHRIARGE